MYVTWIYPNIDLRYTLVPHNCTLIAPNDTVIENI
jgi:hypothetical protein